MPYVDTDRARVCWEERGSGEPILLVMGAFFGQKMWFRAVDAMSTRYRVISFDNRGVGGTTSDGPYTIGDLADDGFAVLDAAGVEDAHVYGVSMGGLTVQEMALTRPERVRSLILGCTGAPSPTTAARRRTLLARVVAGLRPHIPIGIAARLGESTLYGKGTPRVLIDEDRAVIVSTPRAKDLTARQDAAIGAYESASRVGAITAPTLVVHGNADKVVGIELGRELAGLIPGARFVELDGAGHNYVTDQVDGTNALVLEFIDSVEAERAGAAPGATSS